MVDKSLNDIYTEDKYVNVNELCAGDLVRFYNSGVGGFLFGIVVDQPELRVWMSNNRWASLDDIASVIVLHNVDDVADHFDMQDIGTLLDQASANGVYCSFDREDMER